MVHATQATLTDREKNIINPHGKLDIVSDSRRMKSLRRNYKPQPQGGYYLATSLPVLEGQIALVDV